MGSVFLDSQPLSLTFAANISKFISKKFKMLIVALHE